MMKVQVIDDKESDDQSSILISADNNNVTIDYR